MRQLHLYFLPLLASTGVRSQLCSSNETFCNPWTPPGNSLGQGDPSDKESCRQSCLEDPDCNYFTFVEGLVSFCSLFRDCSSVLDCSFLSANDCVTEYKYCEQ